MESMIGLTIIIECPSCAQVMEVKLPAGTARLLKSSLTSFSMRCPSCGRLGGIDKIKGFKQCEFTIKDKKED
jgi:uncharacterized Zn finger protein